MSILTPSVYSTKWSSLFLRKLLRELLRVPTREFREEFRWITGLAVGSVHVPLALLPVEYASASAGGVVVESLSNVRTLRLLDLHGHQVLATGHTHPGLGWRSVTPSSTDKDMHRRFELAGYTLVGLIFSADGWLRFFSWRQDFSIEVHGNGIEQYESDLFRVVPLLPHSHTVRPGQGQRRTPGVGNAR